MRILRLVRHLGIAAALCGLLALRPALAHDEDDIRAGRALLAREYPQVLRHLARNDGFGGPTSPLLATRMQDRSPELVAEARRLMTVEPRGKGLWLIRFPYVNVVLVETRDSLVLIDTGYAAIGPVLRDLVPTLSKKPLKTIVLSHTHVDHAYGAFALLGDRPEIIATDKFATLAAVDIRMRGSIAKYNHQPLALQPSSMADFTLPTRTFSGTLEKRIGGERFVFIEAPGETEDQLYVWLPDRRVVVTADYYQGFLPNAGNGKRMQRHVEEWTAGLRHMVSLRPALLLPMHGAAIEGEHAIAEQLGITADAMEHITQQVIAGLNRGDRKDIVISGVTWPERFAKAPNLAQSYVRPEDIGAMVAKRWTGWWDDIPSHFNALPFEREAAEALRLAGGVPQVAARARELIEREPRLATRLADWAFFGAPEDPAAMQLAVEIYMRRIAMPDTPLQESIVYFNHAALARLRLEQYRKGRNANNGN